MAPGLWNTEQQNKRHPTKRIEQTHTYTQATEGKKCHWGVFNVKEKLYICDGGEEDLIELNEVTTCTHFKEENQQRYEECLCSHVHVCACNASFYRQHMKYIAFANIPGHRQLLLYIDKLSFSMGLKGKKKINKKISLMHIAM